ncbi:helix-turn-helix transcriptional regulator [Alphaproteobacteria bacterium endosymbiont of Tiliacea citrago]|uniref:helix-turn-helix domain-containing protein n=1 Tax=Alphaproteobacteria bacterium endosymbiont of Tiliacea citrago TaxID=3077944 RepID=UPI00313D3670
MNLTNSALSDEVIDFCVEGKKDVNSVVQRNAKVLRALRKKKEYTLYDLSKLSGLSPSYISRLEAGARRLNTEIISKLALALNCKEDAFFQGGSAEDIVETFASENGFKKNLPLYRVISEGLDVTDNPHSVIILTSAMDYVFRPPKLSSSDFGFAIYACNNNNTPRYKMGDILYFDSFASYQNGDTLMIVDNNGYMFIGELTDSNDDFTVLSMYSNHYKQEISSKFINKMFKLVSVEFQ